MASTPSASALSAVLRCRGNIWTRNPPTKRPAASAYSLGLSAGTLRDSTAERTGSPQSATWEAFPRCVAVGGRLTVAYKVVGKTPREKDSREVNKLCFPKLSQPPRDAHSAPPGVQKGQLARRLTPNLPGRDKCSKIIHMIKYESCAAHICRITFVQDMSELPAGMVKLSVTSPCLVTGHIPSFVLSGWSTLRRSCLSLTALVSEIIFYELAVLCGSNNSLHDAQQHLLDEEKRSKDALQANVHIHTSSKDNSGQSITEDRPD